MIIKCLALDDEPLALDKMSNYIRKTPFLELTRLCRSGFEAFDYLSKSEIDLLFADINMPDVNGLDFVKSLQKKPQVIFTTAFSEYAFEGFKVNALDYLLKPIGYNEFLKSANKARNYFETLIHGPGKEGSDREYLFVKSDYKVVRISLNEIIYIEGMREYVRIHLVSGKSVMTLLSLHVLEEQLPSAIFMRVHRSYIVNLQKIMTIDHSRIIFDGKVHIPVSEQYKEFFQKFLNLHSL
jgi:two-component system LytT family response regulator